MNEISILNKQELCNALNWSAPRLDRRLTSDPNFPVRKRGTRAGGWEFVLADVMAHLTSPPADGAVPRPGRPPKTAAEEAAALAAAPAEHQGEATAKQRKDQASAALLEDKLRRDRGELLDREELRMVIGDALARFSSGLDSLPEQIVKRLGLEDAKTERVREVVNELRAALVQDLTAALA